MAFEIDGHHVRAFQDPLVALPHLIAQPPEVLILNGKMPGMHGIAFFQQFRRYSRCPVIFLSASAEEIEDTLLDMGLSAEGYVAKPFSTRGVIAMSIRLLRRAAPG